MYSSFTCDNDNCGINPQFLSENSDTYDDSNSYNERITYGGGYLDGTVIRDSVFIETMEVRDQEIALVTSEDDESTPNFSCVIGLSFPELAPRGETLLFDNMMDQGVLGQNLFTTYYYDDEIHADLYFGGILDHYYEGEINYTPVQKREHWNIRIDDVLVGGVSTGICDTERGCQGLVDTGTNSNTIEQPYYDTFVSQVLPDQRMRLGFDWGDDAEVDLPDIEYVIGGVTYSFTWREWTKNVMRTWILDTQDMQVFEDAESPAIVLGVSFLQKYFTVWDRSDDSAPRIGFAEKAHLDSESGDFSEVDSIVDNSA